MPTLLAAVEEEVKSRGLGRSHPQQRQSATQRLRTQRLMMEWLASLASGNRAESTIGIWETFDRNEG